ncbi:MAG: 2-hydroxyacyl-CoA dehydratase [Erysipelotrichaceae bacterium]|nr:2-hydroxyacyl-CoA dehydratase [Erysipelotrichaceae bacterium]
MNKEYPKFREEMKDTHTILVPNMCPTHFTMIRSVFKWAGYNLEILGNRGSQVSELGLKYCHNDTCYPALLVIGQFLDALNSGEYDLQHTALLITQTGGGCRASNYIHLIRKALEKSGYGYIPVVSLNFSGLDDGLPLNMPVILRALSSVYLGDCLDSLANQIRPYELNKGETDEKVNKWLNELCEMLEKGEFGNLNHVKAYFDMIAEDFSHIETVKEEKLKVGIVGEIYVKYSPLGNNDLKNFLEEQGCEVNMPGLMGFCEYCIENATVDIELYGGNRLKEKGPQFILNYFDTIERSMVKAFEKYHFHAPLPFKEMKKNNEGIISKGAKMGEGWLLPSEMVELIESGFSNIVCAQPFGCLPNHIVGKGVINRIREIYPEANITPIDYDPSATRVNQENRIKLMLAIGRENLENNKK